MNVGGSPETPAFINKLMSDHGVDVVGITETHLKPDGKFRVEYFAINAPRPLRSEAETQEELHCYSERPAE